MLTREEFEKEYASFRTDDAGEIMALAEKVNKEIPENLLCVAKQFTEGFYLELQDK